MLSTARVNNAQIISYTPPKLYTGKEWYVGYMVYNPITRAMCRQRIKLNHIKKLSERKEKAKEIINTLSIKLREGWNPWIDPETEKEYHSFWDVCECYDKYITKMYQDDIYREKTYKDYKNRIDVLQDYNRHAKYPIKFIYQMDRRFVSDFLDYIYISRENSVVTRNNYLGWLSTFSTWLVQKLYLKSKPTEGFQSFAVRRHTKERIVLSDADLGKLHNYLTTNNKYFLLACYILHYMLVRPKEMSYLQLKHINLKKCTMTLDESFTKNRQTSTITMPKHVIELMIDLKIFEHSDSDYLFSTGFKPGAKWINSVAFRKYWDKIRKDLRWGSQYKFYSLKDTGITNMLRHCDVLSVRDQARHSSILMTDIYTPADLKDANQLILNYEGIL